MRQTLDDFCFSDSFIANTALRQWKLKWTRLQLSLAKYTFSTFNVASAEKY